MPKTTLHATRLQLSYAKNGLKKTMNIRKMRPFWKLTKMANRRGQNYHLGQKLKLQKKCQKRLFNSITFVLCKKTSPKNNECSKIDAILKTDKNGQFAKAIVHQRAAGLMLSNSLELYPCCWRTTSKDWEHCVDYFSNLPEWLKSLVWNQHHFRFVKPAKMSEPPGLVPLQTSFRSPSALSAVHVMKLFDICLENIVWQ